MKISLESLLLETEGGRATVCDEQASVAATVGLMARENASAVIVVSATGDQLLGIFTQSDLLRCHPEGAAPPLEALRMAEVMSRPLTVAQAGDTVQDALAVMIKAAIGHLPIIQHQALVGLLTFRDLAAHHIAALRDEIEHLQEYIHALQHAARD